MSGNHSSSKNPDSLELKARIKAQAIELGFSAVGFSAASLPSHIQDRLHSFIAQGRHGDMGWLSERSHQRQSPKSLWPDANSVIVLGMNYGPDSDPLLALAQKSSATISVYAQNKDYHDLVKKRLKRLARWMVEEAGCELKVFVDTAPVMEKPLSAQGGIGWQGKHTNLVSREFGAWMFLGAIFTTRHLSPDEPEKDHCGSCQECLDICPTKAFPAPYQLDARRCISYLSIEHEGAIPMEFRKAMGNRIYGCDDCLAVCPWNKFASTAKETAFHARENLRNPALAELAALDDASFRLLFSGSPIKRSGRNRFIRNVLIAIGNSNDQTLVPYAIDLLNDQNSSIRGSAIWALGELTDAEKRQTLYDTYAQAETEINVRHEWDQMLAR